jgi:hypothetical protein
MPRIVEHAAADAATLDGYRSLARHTGLPLEEGCKLAVEGELRSLFGANGRLMRAAEIRSRQTGGPGIDGRQALDEILRRKPAPIGALTGWEALAQLRAKRAAWQYVS